MATPIDLAELLDALDPNASLVQRHLWLIKLVDWVRGDRRSPSASVARLSLPTSPQPGHQASAAGPVDLADHGDGSHHVLHQPDPCHRLFTRTAPAHEHSGP